MRSREVEALEVAHRPSRGRQGLLERPIYLDRQIARWRAQVRANSKKPRAPLSKRTSVEDASSTVTAARGIDPLSDKRFGLGDDLLDLADDPSSQLDQVRNGYTCSLVDHPLHQCQRRQPAVVEPNGV